MAFGATWAVWAAAVWFSLVRSEDASPFFSQKDSFKDCPPGMNPEATVVNKDTYIYIEDMVTWNYDSCTKAYKTSAPDWGLSVDIRGTLLPPSLPQLMVAPAFPPVTGSYKTYDSTPLNTTRWYDRSVTFALLHLSSLEKTEDIGQISIRIKAQQAHPKPVLQKEVLSYVFVPISGFFIVIGAVAIIAAVYQRRHRKTIEAAKQEIATLEKLKRKAPLHTENRGPDTRSRFSFRGNTTMPRMSILPSYSSSRASDSAEPDNKIHHDKGYGLFDHMTRKDQERGLVTVTTSRIFPDHPAPTEPTGSHELWRLDGDGQAHKVTDSVDGVFHSNQPLQDTAPRTSVSQNIEAPSGGRYAAQPQSDHHQSETPIEDAVNMRAASSKRKDERNRVSGMILGNPLLVDSSRESVRKGSSNSDVGAMRPTSHGGVYANRRSNLGYLHTLPVERGSYPQDGFYENHSFDYRKGGELSARNTEV